MNLRWLELACNLFGRQSEVDLADCWGRRRFGVGARIVLPKECEGEYQNMFARERVELEREIAQDGVLGRFSVGVLVGVE